MTQHVISIKQFLDKQKLRLLFASANEFQTCSPDQYPKPLHGLVIATLFYEPSTRTRLSFESAIMRLGGSVLSTENAAEVSSAVKGESLEDTIKVINGYADAIIIRHKEPGSAERASHVSTVPIINAGDGSGEHPTQALLDLYTIFQYKPSIDGLKVGLAGDLLHSRTLHSLLYLLAIYKVKLYLIAPDSFQLSPEYIKYLRSKKITYHIVNAIEDCLGVLDVIYINRLQMERHSGAIKVKAPALTRHNVKLLKSDAIIMNPLPRVTEIEAEVDTDTRAIYFQQARNGLFVRMALLNDILSKHSK